MWVLLELFWFCLFVLFLFPPSLPQKDLQNCGLVLDISSCLSNLPRPISCLSFPFYWAVSSFHPPTSSCHGSQLPCPFSAKFLFSLVPSWNQHLFQCFPPISLLTRNLHRLLSPNSCGMICLLFGNKLLLMWVVLVNVISTACKVLVQRTDFATCMCI